MSKLDIKTLDVAHKLVVIRDADIPEASMADMSRQLKKLGAREVIFTYGVEIQTLSDEELKNIGLCRVETMEALVLESGERDKLNEQTPKTK